MNDLDILERLKKDYPELIYQKLPFPKPFMGDGNIKAIILGADPTHIVNGKPKTVEMVFGLEKEKSPYWNSMKRNIDLLSNLSMHNIYVQNICRNYFTKETSANKDWMVISRNFWSKILKSELDEKFERGVPVLATTEFVLHAIKNTKGKVKAAHIYNNCITIPETENLLSREIIAFYRHHKYSLKNWNQYRIFIDNKLGQV